jgi:hypothetical protein
LRPGGKKDHVDLVLALALIIWYGEQTNFGDASPYVGPKNTISEQIAERARRMEQKIYPPYLRRPGTMW